MPQFYFEKEIQVGDTLCLGDDVYHHLKNVRRAHAGDEVKLRTKDGTLFTSKICNFEKKHINVEVIDSEILKINPYTLTLAMPVLKAKKNEFIIEKAVEIGVTHFIVVHYERSVPAYDSLEKKLEKWRKTAYEAYKQCYAPFLPEIAMILKSKDFYQMHEDDIKIIADVHSDTIWKSNCIESKENITIAIGPEGGFTSEELNTARDNGWNHTKFGFNQLRAETASVVIPAIIRSSMKTNT